MGNMDRSAKRSESREFFGIFREVRICGRILTISKLSAERVPAVHRHPPRSCVGIVEIERTGLVRSCVEVSQCQQERF